MPKPRRTNTLILALLACAAIGSLLAAAAWVAYPKPQEAQKLPEQKLDHSKIDTMRHLAHIHLPQLLDLLSKAHTITPIDTRVDTTLQRTISVSQARGTHPQSFKKAYLNNLSPEALNNIENMPVQFTSTNSAQGIGYTAPLFVQSNQWYATVPYDLILGPLDLLKQQQ